ncbi:hypothetical protein [Chitinophaga sp. 30R24]|uniref:hypothetical protein n=1 Tax=Chitinophaga sp. 30R24 TaxID=3248838 RepID=UPI003B98502C
MGTGLYLNHHWNKLLKRELQGYVCDLSDSLYTVKFQDLRLNVLAGSVTLEKASMVVDTAVYHRLLAQQKAPSNLYTIALDRLEIKYFKPWQLFRGKNLQMGFLKVSGSNIIMEQNATVIDTSLPQTAYQHISSKLKSIFIGHLLLDSTNFKYIFTHKDSSRVIHQFHRLNIRVNNFLIDSLSINDPSRFLYARNYELSMKDYVIRTRDSLYWVNIKDIRYDAALHTFHIGQFQVQPRYSRPDFQQKTGIQKDLYEVQFNNISIRDLNPRLLLQQQQIWAQRVDIRSGKIQIYRNRMLPMPPGNKLGQYPHQLLQQLNIPINIDTLAGSNVDLAYTELNPETEQTGTVRFSHIHGLFNNITNIDSMIAQKGHTTVNCDAIFMQSGKLTAHFDFSLNDKSGKFAVSGQLKNMNGKDLNVVTQPLGKIEIRSCNIQDLTFNIKGDEWKASGKVKMLYQNLRIAILKQDSKHKEFTRKGFISLVANTMIINSSNPLKGEKARIANVTYERDIQKSFFNLVWKTLFEGVKDIAGARAL